MKFLSQGKYYTLNELIELIKEKQNENITG